MVSPQRYPEKRQKERIDAVIGSTRNCFVDALGMNQISIEDAG
jgi:hypothetical protein